MTLSPLKRFFLAALLWLPAMFFVWVYWSSVFALPATSTARAVLNHSFDGLFSDVYRGFPRHLVDGGDMPVQPGTPTEGSHARDDHLLFLRFNEAAMPPAMRAQKRATGEEPLPMVNTMIYGYGLALIWGLILATPLLSTGFRLVQFLAGWLAIAMVQAFGATTSSLVQAMQHLGADAVRAAGVHPEALAMLHQFGYLILPPVVPVVLWMVMNRSFIQELTRRPAAAGAEPGPDRPVQPDTSVPGRDPEHGS